MGMIYRPKYKDKDGNVRASKVYWIKYYRNGKPYRESAKSEKLSDARNLLKRREGNIAHGKPPGIHLDRVTFEDLKKDLLTDYELNNRKSKWRVEISIAHLERFFEGWRVVNITPSEIQQFVNERKKEGASAATINRDLSALKRMFSLGAKYGKVGSIPHAEKFKENNVRKGFLEHESYKKLHDALPSYLQPVLTFAYHTGWRRGEILNLTWDRVNLKVGTVRLETGETKNDRARNLVLIDELKALLRQLWNKRKNLDCNYVFTRNGKRIKDFRGAWKKACTDTGLQGKLFHDLRRTGVRNSVRAGISEQVAMKISGHKTRSVFDRYNITDDRDLEDAARKQQAYFETVAGKVSGKVGQNQEENEVDEAAQVIKIMK